MAIFATPCVCFRQAAEEADHALGMKEDHDHDEERRKSEHERARDSLSEMHDSRLRMDQSCSDQRVRDRVTSQRLGQRHEQRRTDHRPQNRTDAADDADHDDLNGEVERQHGARIDEADIDRIEIPASEVKIAEIPRAVFL